MAHLAPALDAVAGMGARPAWESGPDSVFARLVAVALGVRDPGLVHPLADVLAETGLEDPSLWAGAHAIDVLNLLRDHLPWVQPREIPLLQRLARYVVEEEAGDAQRLVDPDRSVDGLRESLLAIKGLGRPTADALLLHALDRPAFPVSRGAYRVMVRHGWLDRDSPYDEAHDLVMDHAQGRVHILRALERGFAEIARVYCRVSRPQCQGCPLEPYLPSGGPFEIDG